MNSTTERETSETRLWSGVSYGILTECSEQVLGVSAPVAPRRETQPKTSSNEVAFNDNYIRFGGVEQPRSRCIAPFRRERGAVMGAYRRFNMVAVYAEIDELNLSLEAFRLYIHFNCMSHNSSIEAFEHAETCFRKSHPDATSEGLVEIYESALSELVTAGLIQVTHENNQRCLTVTDREDWHLPLKTLQRQSVALLAQPVETTRNSPKTRKRKPISTQLRYRLLKQSGFKCQACGTSASDTELQIDHVIPFSKGGKDAEENYQVLCATCNHGKGDMYEE